MKRKGRTEYACLSHYDIRAGCECLRGESRHTDELLRVSDVMGTHPVNMRQTFLQIRRATWPGIFKSAGHPAVLQGGRLHHPRHGALQAAAPACAACLQPNLATSSQIHIRYVSAAPIALMCTHNHIESS